MCIICKVLEIDIVCREVDDYVVVLWEKICRQCKHDGFIILLEGTALLDVELSLIR
jgi:hypothetical protein